MGRKYKIRDQEKLYFVTFTIVNWIDVYIRNIYREIIIDDLKYCQEKKGLIVSAWCIMTSHVHLIIGTTEGYLIEDAIRDLKSCSSRKTRKCIEGNFQESRREWMMWMFKRAGKKNVRNNDFQFWQQHNHPVELNTNTMMEDRLNYIHNNPVEGGFVSKAEDWIWSSAREYTGERTGLLKLLFIE
jgi:REP element-mobilizing transposase RayT